MAFILQLLYFNFFYETRTRKNTWADEDLIRWHPRLAREQMQETVFNTIQDGVIVIDSDGVVQYANDAALGLIGPKSNDIGVTRL